MLRHAVSLKDQIVSVDLDVNGFGSNSEEIGFKDECVFGFIEIDRWAPGAQLAVAAPRTVNHFIE